MRHHTKFATAPKRWNKKYMFQTVQIWYIKLGNMIAFRKLSGKQKKIPGLLYEDWPKLKQPNLPTQPFNIWIQAYSVENYYNKRLLETF